MQDVFCLSGSDVSLLNSHFSLVYIRRKSAMDRRQLEDAQHMMGKPSYTSKSTCEFDPSLAKHSH